eukprot:c41446_g1_i1 orf=600-839(+)
MPLQAIGQNAILHRVCYNITTLIILKGQAYMHTAKNTTCHVNIHAIRSTKFMSMKSNNHTPRQTHTKSKSTTGILTKIF